MQQNWDIGAVAGALFVAWLGPQLGPVLGIYSVIVIAAVIGAGIALARKPADEISRPTLFVALLVPAAVITTVPLTMLLVHWVPALTLQIAMPMIALLIAAIGSDWVRVFAWAWGFVRKLTGQRAGVQGDQP